MPFGSKHSALTIRRDSRGKTMNYVQSTIESHVVVAQVAVISPSYRESRALLPGIISQDCIAQLITTICKKAFFTLYCMPRIGKRIINEYEALELKLVRYTLHYWIPSSLWGCPIRLFFFALPFLTRVVPPLFFDFGSIVITQWIPYMLNNNERRNEGVSSWSVRH